MINIMLSTYDFDGKWCFEELRGYLQADFKVVILPFSFRESQVKNADQWDDFYSESTGRYYNVIIKPLLSYGIKEDQIQWINYFSDSKEIARSKVEKSDLIFLLGGLPDKTMDRVREFGLSESIEKHQGVIMGVSAGAMVQMAEYHISPDTDYSSFMYSKGLNLINDFDIEVHFNFTKVQEMSILKVIKEKNKDIYAIADDGCLIRDNHNLRTVGNVYTYKAESIKLHD